MKIIFLDFDGPVSNALTVLAYGDDLRMSVDTCHILNNICEVADAKIVCTSTRVIVGHAGNKSENFELFHLAGMDLRHIHSDWACRDTYPGTRRNAILEWLARHPEIKEYVIIDDEKVRLPNFVKVGKISQISLKQWERIAKTLGFPLVDAFNHARMKAQTRPEVSGMLMPDKEPVIFLDFDGTISTQRLWMATGDTHSMDPVALQILGHICKLSGAKIVCTSTDITHDNPENLKNALRRFENAGFDIAHLHIDWAARETRGRREDTIREWLDRHPAVKRYVVVDDGLVDLPHVVRVDRHNGILVEHCRDIAIKLNLNLSQVFHEAQKSTNLFGQLLLPLEHWQDDFNQRLIKRGNEP